MGSRNLAAFDTEDSFTFEAVKLLSEAAAVGEEVVALDGEHEECVELIEGVEDTQEVAGIALSGEDEEVAD